MQSSVAKSPPGQSIRFVTFASSIGNVIDWYDFSVYGSLAVVLAQVFFPAHSVLQSLLNTLLVFGLGYIMRPVGALFFGWFGDRIGRKTTFLVTLLGMGGTTFIIGLLPTASQVGELAGILLTLVRFLQGFFVGGEYGGGVSYITENAPNNRRGYFVSWIQASFAVGIVLTDMVLLPLSSYYGTAGLEAWAWRVPFLLSAVLVLIGLWLRLKLTETPMFSAITAQGRKSKNPIADAFRHYAKEILLVGFLGMAGGSAVIGYVGAVYILTYMQSVLKVAYYPSYLIFLPAIISVIVWMVLFGWLSDKWGRKRIFIAGQLLGAVFYIPLFIGLGGAYSIGSIPLMIFLAILVEIPYGMLQGVLGSWLVEQFPTAVRYTAFSFPYQLGLGLFGGFQPYIATWLLTNFGGVTYTSSGAIASVAFPWIGLLYTTAGALMGAIILIIFSKETKGKDLWKEINEPSNAMGRQ